MAGRDNPAVDRIGAAMKKGGMGGVWQPFPLSGENSTIFGKIVDIALIAP